MKTPPTFKPVIGIREHNFVLVHVFFKASQEVVPVCFPNYDTFEAWHFENVDLISKTVISRISCYSYYDPFKTLPNEKT